MLFFFNASVLREESVYIQNSNSFKITNRVGDKTVWGRKNNYA